MEFNIIYKHSVRKHTFSQCKTLLVVHIFYLSVLVCVPPKAKAEVKIWVQVVYLGDDPRKHSMKVGNKQG